jgi:hypothetical protein
MYRYNPTIIFPEAYWLPMGGRLDWYWCKIGAICDIASHLALQTGIEFDPTPEELVSRFAALARLNRLPEGVTEDDIRRRPKIFRYSRDGHSLGGVEVPTQHPHAPPYVPFELPIEKPYPRELFVQEDWARSTLSAIQLGAIAAAHFNRHKIGFPPRNSGKGLICLEGEREWMIVQLPSCA